MAKLIDVNNFVEVKKADVIVRARYKLNPLSLKFVTTLIAGIKRSDDMNELYQFKVKDFQELTKLKRKDLYWAVKEALKELLEKPIYIPKGQTPDDNSFLMLNWVASAEYKDGEGIIEFEISNKLRPYLLEAQTKFLKYRLENILPLKSGYSIRMYEILKDWFEMYKRYGNKAEKIIKIDELREMLEIPKSYKYGNSSGVKQRILEKAKKELAEHTDIIFNYEEIKTGRKVTHLKFLIQQNPKKSEDYLANKEMQNLKSFKHFVAYLRKNYSGNLKFFGYKTIKEDNKIKNAWLYLNNKGLVCGITEKNEKIDFNAIESERIYYNWWQVAKTDPNYYYLVLEKQEDFRDIYNTDIEFRTNLNNTIIYLQEERKLK